MSSVSKSSAFPDTVQPGIPRLGDLPRGWSRAPMSTHLYEVRRPVDLQDDVEYDLVTVKRARGGVVKRETKRGRDISVKTQFRVEAGDFLISKRQIVHGACGIVPPELHGSTVSNEYAVLRGHPTIDLEYLKYLSHSIYFQQTCFHSSIGVHIEKMIFKTDKWLSWEFDLPPVAEQRRITEALATWDHALEIADKLISNSRTQKRALVERLISGEQRLSGFNASWEKAPLGTVCSVTTGQPAPNESSAFGDQGLPFIRVSALFDLCEGNAREFELVSADQAAQHRLQTFKPGTLIFAKSGMSARLGRLHILEHDAYLVSHLAALTPSRQLDIRFLKYWFEVNSPATLVQGDGFPSIRTSDIQALEIFLPALKEQIAIGDILATAEGIALAYINERTNLLQEKEGLMQQLLTGKRRVKLEEMAA